MILSPRGRHTPRAAARAAVLPALALLAAGALSGCGAAFVAPIAAIFVAGDTESVSETVTPSVAVARALEPGRAQVPIRLTGDPDSTRRVRVDFLVASVLSGNAVGTGERRERLKATARSQGVAIHLDLQACVPLRFGRESVSSQHIRAHDAIP